MFLDETSFRVRAGTGGNGCASLRREKYAPRGGPDGGVGGDGGSVILRADAQLSTLTDIARRSLYAAENGRKGTGANRTGRKGQDLIVDVPPGTLIRDVVGDQPPSEGRILGELLVPGQTLVAAKGGKGGRGNKAFATSTRQTPRFAEEGVKGEERRIYLELKLLADVGLIGLPNAGKSTLLARISDATPKIADYPFTTLHPNLGIAELSGFRRLVVADIPGLIEGAHEGHGLGIEFLRHIERTRILVHLVSLEAAIPALGGAPEPAQEVPQAKDPTLVPEGKAGDPEEGLRILARDFRTIESELCHYSQSLAQKPRVVVLSKADLFSPEDRELLIREFSLRIGVPVRILSAVTGEGTRDLLQELDRRVRESKAGDPGAVSASSGN